MGEKNTHELVERYVRAYVDHEDRWHRRQVHVPLQVDKGTTIFGTEFDAPEWRAGWVERIAVGPPT